MRNKKKAWYRMYKNQKCKVCQDIKSSKYKDVCESCYYKGYMRNPKHKAHRKAYIKERTRQGNINSIRINCPLCGKRGRVLVMYRVNIGTKNIVASPRQIQHWKYNKVTKKKDYDKVCRILPKDVSLGIKELTRIKQKILERYALDC